MSHTPGRWVVGSNDVYTCVHTGETNVAILVHKRDAHLIAAAPELLETVHLMAQTIHQAYHLDAPGTFEACDRNTCDVARAAIKKAKGEP